MELIFKELAHSLLNFISTGAQKNFIHSLCLYCLYRLPVKVNNVLTVLVYKHYVGLKRHAQFAV